MNYLKSFLCHATKGEVSFQLTKKLKLTPWASHVDGDFGGVSYSNIFAGWLFIQARWTDV